MKWKYRFRRMTVSAPKLTVKTHVPWPLKVLVGAVVLGLGAAVAMYTYDYGRRFSGFNKDEIQIEISRLRAQINDLSEEKDQLTKLANEAESKLSMERSAQQQLARQVKTLEAENTRLKEDMGFFESLMPTSADPGTVTIRSLRAQPDGPPNTLRYKLLVMQGGKPERDFQGQLQLVVNATQNGKPTTLLYPDKSTDTKTSTAQWGVNFRRFQRLEGTVVLPEGTVVKSIQARVLQQGATRAQQSVTVGE
jgi:outer membrane murein-binding lipoprotein Lpp